MYKKLDIDSVVTLQGRIQESISIDDPLNSAVNRRTENHYYFSSSSPAIVSAASASYFLTMLDGPPNLPWSNKLCTITYGIHSSAVSFTSVADKEQRSKIYRLYAKTLLGDEDSIFIMNGVQQTRLIFISMSRNQFKKGLVPKTVTTSWFGGNNIQQPSNASADDYTDVADNSFYTFPGGTAADLKRVVSTTVSGKDINGNSIIRYDTLSGSVGMVFYDHGTFVMIPTGVVRQGGNTYSGSLNFESCEFSGGNTLLNGIANKLDNIKYKCYSNPQITFFKCVAEADEFNYSSNPSFVDSAGQIVVTSGSINNNNLKSMTYITTIGLCNELGEILAVAKTTEPLKKDFNKKIEINVRLIQ